MNPMVYPTPVVKMKISDAVVMDCDKVDIESANGRISCDYVMCYPPGIPILCPGEEITNDVIDFIDACRKASVNLICSDKIKVIKQEL